ncbi:hypothetical protein MKEN_00065500 [Mycena kentingensis (nom. inval.)]|nr:hypothetical protein MKEN_00065500 [Mycena kentingensis (nom. inval.)]
MPVPAPVRQAKQPAHPVNKSAGAASPFRSHISSLCHPGPPPSFGTTSFGSREAWIASLPTWRRQKIRRIDEARPFVDQQGFYTGLAVAHSSASAIKGARAEACIPPVYSLFPVDYSALDRVSGDESQWSNGLLEMEIDDQSQLDVRTSSPTSDVDLADDYQRGAFTPVFEEESPGGPDVGSSPVGPVTPFGEYVDRAVYGSAKSQPTSSSYDLGHHAPYQHKSESTAAPVPEVVTPTATNGYRKLAEPLSEWVAIYVWKACSTGFSLPEIFARPSNVAKHRSVSPPNYLPSAVHSLLLSTLLQPSAVFLAIWYIARLPVYFDAVVLGAEYVKELRFRATLFGNGDQEATEASAPFRLIVLGCMLANKWLDDHTFSNKTWHSISNVPIHTLNKLESLALDIFGYDLSVPSLDWSQWLAHLVSYHELASSPSHPQPISRPSTNPHAIVRKALDDIIQAPAASGFNPANPQPVFLGVEERRRDHMDKEPRASDMLEFDLDEDGPLREEYMPKRRISSASSTRVFDQRDVPVVENGNAWERKAIVAKDLPPPARWSPAADEPILRERNRASGQYVAVQPPLPPAMVSYPVGSDYPAELGYANQNWPPVGTYVTVKPPPVMGYVFEAPPLHVAHSSYSAYPFVPALAVPHLRSQSLSYDQDNSLSHNRLRSCSQSFESQSRFDESAGSNEVDAHWQVPPVHYGYAPPAFTCSGWLRV